MTSLREALKAIKALKTMQVDLKIISDDKLIKAYHTAKEAYEYKPDGIVKSAMDIIKIEIDRRGLKL